MISDTFISTKNVAEAAQWFRVHFIIYDTFDLVYVLELLNERYPFTAVESSSVYVTVIEILIPLSRLRLFIKILPQCVGVSYLTTQPEKQ